MRISDKKTQQFEVEKQNKNRKQQQEQQTFPVDGVKDCIKVRTGWAVPALLYLPSLSCRLPTLQCKRAIKMASKKKQTLFGTNLFKWRFDDHKMSVICKADAQKKISWAHCTFNGITSELVNTSTFTSSHARNDLSLCSSEGGGGGRGGGVIWVDTRSFLWCCVM